MKKVLTTIIIALLTTISYSQIKVKWYTIEEAEKLAKENPRPLFIDVYTSWCGWCKVMDNKTFSNEGIAKILNEKFYPVKFNAETKETFKFKGKEYKSYGRTHSLTKEFFKTGGGGYPSFSFYTDKLEHYFVLSGFRKPKDIEPILEYVGSLKFRTEKYEEFIKTFKSNL